jgi:hypothetical protein
MMIRNKLFSLNHHYVKGTQSRYIGTNRSYLISNRTYYSRWSVIIDID